MPIDPNIALGIRPIEQPNVINQMGQMMQLRQLQQGYESENALRDFYAQGGDVNTPEGRNRLMQAAPKLGAEILQKTAATAKTNKEVAKLDTEIVDSKLKQSRSFLDTVSTPQEYIAWHEANHKDPILGPMLASRGVTAEQSRAQIDAALSKPGGFQELLRKSAMGMDAFSKEMMQTERTLGAARIGAAPAHARLAYDIANPTQHFFPDENGNLMRAPTRGAGGATQVPVGNALAPQMGPVVNNMTAPGQGATAPVSAMPPANVPLSQIPPAAPQQFAKVAQTGTMAGYERLPDGTMRAIPGGPADTAAKAPEGYRRTSTGDLEFIKGGPKDPNVQAQQAEVKLSTKDIAAREAKYPQATTALNGFEAKTAKFERDIDELLANKKGLGEITGYIAGRTNLSAMSKEGQRALALYNTITAKGGFSELQDMRNSSPTGGALGNVSNQEGQQLINSFGALARTQNAEDLRRSLATAKSDLQGSKQRIKEAYDLTYEYKNSSAGSKPNAAKEDPLGIR